MKINITIELNEAVPRRRTKMNTVPFPFPFSSSRFSSGKLLSLVILLIFIIFMLVSGWKWSNLQDIWNFLSKNIKKFQKSFAWKYELQSKTNIFCINVYYYHRSWPCICYHSVSMMLKLDGKNSLDLAHSALNKGSLSLGYRIDKPSK